MLCSIILLQWIHNATLQRAQLFHHTAIVVGYFFCFSDFKSAISEGGERDVVNYLTDADHTSKDWQQNLDEGLVIAMKAKQPQIMKLLIEAGANCDQTYGNGNRARNPLFFEAFGSGEPAILDIFLPKCTNLLNSYFHRENLLHAAVSTGSLDLVKRACKFLDDCFASRKEWCNGISLPFVMPSDNDNADEIQAQNPNNSVILEYLLEQGVDVSYSDESGKPYYLNDQAKAGNMEEVRILLKYGADKMQPDSDGCYPWMAACEMEHYGIVDELVNGIDLNQKLPDGKSFLHHACDMTYKPCVKYLLRQGVEVDCKDSDHNYTPLISMLTQLLEYYDISGFLDFTDKHKQIVMLLIKADADVNARYKREYSEGQTLLMEATFLKKRHLEFFMQHGGDINAVSPDGLTALWVAVAEDCFSKTESNLVENLLAWNIDISISQYTYEARTPLQYAFDHDCHKLCDILLNAGCSLCYMKDYLTEELMDPWESSDDMKRVRDTILERCSAPYRLQVLARQAVLRAMGLGILVEKVDQLDTAPGLKKFLLTGKW